MSNPTTTGPILPQPSQSTLYSAYPYGDQRYLTDVAEGRFDTVRLLTNPPAIDRIMWAGRHLSNSFLVPVKSHSMSIYHKKLANIANDRNRVRAG